MGRLLQTQHKLYSLKIQNPRFSAQLWKARLQASVEKPDSLVAAAMQRLQETSISLRTGKSGVFFSWMETTGAFFLCFAHFSPTNSNTSGPIYSVAFRVYSASIIKPLLHLVVPWLDTAHS